MEERLIKRETLTDIADAIREKAGLQGHIPVKDYASNIRSLEKVKEYDCAATVNHGATPTFADNYTEGYADGKTNGYNIGYAEGKKNGYDFGKEEVNAEIAEINNDLKETLYGTLQIQKSLEENVAQVGTDFDGIREVIRDKLGLAEDVAILPSEMPSRVDEVYETGYSAGYESLPNGDEVYY